MDVEDSENCSNSKMIIKGKQKYNVNGLCHRSDHDPINYSVANPISMVLRNFSGNFSTF